MLTFRFKGFIRCSPRPNHTIEDYDVFEYKKTNRKYLEGGRVRLFCEIEKCFPEMRKHRKELLKRNPALSETQQKAAMVLWIEDTFLQEKSRIYQLFLQAGVGRRRIMANEMLIWHMYNWRLEKR